MVSFGDDIAAGLTELREHAVSNMRDACVIERRTGRVLDEVTLEYTDTWAQVYVGRCRVKVKDTQPAESEPGGRTFVVNDAVVQLPVDATHYADGDRVTVTASEFDPALVGVVLSVTSRDPISQATSRRLHVSEVTS